MVNDKTLVEGVSLTYKEGTKVYTSTQVGKECQFTTGLAVVIPRRITKRVFSQIPNVLKRANNQEDHEESFSLRHLSLLKLSGYRLIIGRNQLSAVAEAEQQGKNEEQRQHDEWVAERNREIQQEKQRRANAQAAANKRAATAAANKKARQDKLGRRSLCGQKTRSKL
ncbi:putative lipoprotein [Escherichia coli]|nr:putative lipoprotein [Escherichia coli]